MPQLHTTHLRYHPSSPSKQGVASCTTVWCFSVTRQNYTIFLPCACDSFAKVLNDPLTMSHEAFASWNANRHSVCVLISWILASTASNDASVIRTVSLEYTGSLIARIDTALGDSGDRAKSLNSSILCLYWFAVELLVCTCCSTTGIDKDISTAISARVVGLANRLRSHMSSPMANPFFTPAKKYGARCVPSPNSLPMVYQHPLPVWAHRGNLSYSPLTTSNLSPIHKSIAASCAVYVVAMPTFVWSCHDA